MENNYFSLKYEVKPHQSINTLPYFEGAEGHLPITINQLMPSFTHMIFHVWLLSELNLKYLPLFFIYLLKFISLFNLVETFLLRLPFGYFLLMIAYILSFHIIFYFTFCCFIWVYFFCLVSHNFSTLFHSILKVLNHYFITSPVFIAYNHRYLFFPPYIYSSC